MKSNYSSGTTLTTLFAAGAVVLGLGLAAKAAEPITLKFWLESRGAPDSISDALADFTTKTGIQVKRFDFEHSSVSSGLSKVVGTDLFPDVFVAYPGIGLTGYLLDAKQAEPLDSYYKQYGWLDKLQPSGIAMGTHGGVKYSVPFTTYGLAAWYKRSTFDKAGIKSTPKTFDEFVAAMDKLVSAGIAPLSFGGKGPWDPMRLVDFLFEHYCGAATFDALRSTEANYTTTPCALTAVTKYAEWTTKYMVKDWEGLDPAASQHYAPIFSEKAAITFDPSWAGDNLKKNGQKTADYGAFDLPTDTGRTYSFGEGLWISSSSKYKEEAAKLIDFLVSKEVQEKYAGKMRSAIPANVNAVFGADLDDFSKAFNAIVQNPKATGAYLPSDQAFPAKVLVDSFHRNVTEKAGFHLAAPKDALAALQADIDIFKKTGK